MLQDLKKGKPCEIDAINGVVCQWGRKLNVKIGIITVPVDSAQQVCDMLVESGILAIWNFAQSWS